MDSERKKLLEEAQQGQRIVMAAIKQEVELPTFLDLDISMAQLKGLMTLARNPRETVGQFAETLRIGRSAASLLADRLVQDGLVERAEDTVDRRKMVLCLSQRGEELVTRLHQGRIERDPMSHWLEQLNEKDLGALVQGLRALASIAQAETGITDPRQIFALREHSPRKV